jgi:hypothetical protein
MVAFPNSQAGRLKMRESFEHFYLTKVGLGEGCGCAEHVTRIREIDNYAANRAGAPMATNIVPPVFAMLARLLRRFAGMAANTAMPILALPRLLRRRAREV